MDPSLGRPEDLPDFRHPPLTETVLSLQFDRPQGLTTAHMGLLWQQLRHELPQVEEQPPLEPVVETFGIVRHPSVEISIEERSPTPRLWFISADQSELIQVQSTRFIHNWRKGPGTRPYPRYEPIREKFRREVAVLERFLDDEKLGRLAVNQCEVTYINHIEPTLWERHGRLDFVMRMWSPAPEGAFLPEPEDVAVRMRFVIPDEEKRPIGRLHVALQPARKRDDDTPILVLNLTARGAPLHDGIDGAFAFFDLGRTWIVKAFAELTTAAMQQVWGRADA